MASRSQKSDNPSYGAPLSTPKPGRKGPPRPKVGDKSDDTHLLDKPKKRTPSKPPVKKDKKDSGSKFRDWRGTEGQIDDAEGVKRK